jgi:pimeloyl-ACP methyl ester carboxylesterase
MVSTDELDVSRSRGSLIAYEHLEYASRADLQEIANTFPGDIAVKRGANLYRVTYWTELKGEPITASGLLSIPDDVSEPKGIFAYFHGTNATRASAPSQPDRVDGNEETAIFAGNGYYVILPDYIGLGVSDMPQAYLITDPDVDASLDLFVAARETATLLKKPWPSSLFMMGFSQGGQIVAGTHRRLEQKSVAGLKVRGSVGIAGPYDLRVTSLPKALENDCLLCVGYLAWVASSYSSYNGAPLEKALLPEYAATVPGLFDGSKTETEIASALPVDPRKLFKPNFLEQLRNNRDNWLTKGMDQNETYAWVPVAPFRMYVGENDTDVSPAASRAFFDYAKSRGGNVSLHSLGPVDHQASASMSYAPTLNWFDQLSAGGNGGEAQ